MACLLENGILRDKYVDKCERCSEHIPWTNMYSAIFYVSEIFL